MSGPMPKDPAIRQRRNKSSTRAILPAENAVTTKTPDLPKLPGRKKWHPMAQDYWKAIWSSPMSHEFLHADLFALVRLVMLVNRFFMRGSLDVAREIRMMEQQFGLTPFSRRRLEWTVAQAEEAKDQHEQKRIKRASVIDADPRGVLES